MTDNEMEPIRMPITDVLDLHTFRPGDVPELLEDYIDECLARGIRSVRIIHGKGTGVLKRRVQSLLEKNPRVVSYQDAPARAGGWGATLAELSEKD